MYICTFAQGDLDNNNRVDRLQVYERNFETYVNLSNGYYGKTKLCNENFDSVGLLSHSSHIRMYIVIYTIIIGCVDRLQAHV